MFTIKTQLFDKDLLTHIYNLQSLERKLMSLMNQCITQKHFSKFEKRTYQSINRIIGMSKLIIDLEEKLKLKSSTNLLAKRNLKLRVQELKSYQSFLFYVLNIQYH